MLFLIAFRIHPCFGVLVWTEAAVLRGYGMVVSVLFLAQSAAEIIRSFSGVSLKFIFSHELWGSLWMVQDRMCSGAFEAGS